MVLTSMVIAYLNHLTLPPPFITYLIKIVVYHLTSGTLRKKVKYLIYCDTALPG